MKIFLMSFTKAKSLRLILAGLIAVAFSSCFAENITDSKMSMKEILSKFTTYAMQTQKEWHVPGMAIAIVQDNKIIYAKGFGERNTKGALVTPDTIFSIASCTKSFTAALLAIQIDQGKYTWNTKITKLYPAFKLYDPEATKEFEMRDLIAHDSGLPEDATDTMGSFGYSLEHIIYSLRFIKPVSKFRTQFSYEDIFPAFAGKLIADTAHQKYSVFLRQQLLVPLDMRHTYVESETKLHLLKNVSQRFEYFSGKIYSYPKNSAYAAKLETLEKGANASGGIKSSARDMAKWLIFNMNNGEISGKQLIGKKNMEFIHSPQTAIKTSSADDNLNGETEKFYGEGWFIDTQEYKPYVTLYHSGGGRGMHALMAYIPAKKIGIVILTNTWGNKVPEALYQKFFDLYLNKTPLEDWSKIYLQQEKKFTNYVKKAMSTPDQCQVIKKINLKKYAGIYHNLVYGNLVMAKKGNHLTLKIGPANIVWKLTPCKNNIFQAYWKNEYGMNLPMFFPKQGVIHFTFKKNGDVNTMIIPYLNDNGHGVFVRRKIC